MCPIIELVLNDQYSVESVNRKYQLQWHITFLEKRIGEEVVIEGNFVNGDFDSDGVGARQPAIIRSVYLD